MKSSGADRADRRARPSTRRCGRTSSTCSCSRPSSRRRRRSSGSRSPPPRSTRSSPPSRRRSFGGSEKKYQAELKKEGFTDAQIRENLREKLLEQKIFDHVTKGAAATKSDIDAYYAANLTQFQKPATRDVQEILVGKNKQALANQIYQQLQNGADFAALAKKYSQDPGSKDKGGKFTATKGSDVPDVRHGRLRPEGEDGRADQAGEDARSTAGS